MTVGSEVTMDTRAYFEGRALGLPDLTALGDHFGPTFEIAWLTTLEEQAQRPDSNTTERERAEFASRYHATVCDAIGSAAQTSWGHPAVDALVRLLFPHFTCTIDPEER